MRIRHILMTSMLIVLLLISAGCRRQVPELKSQTSDLVGKERQVELEHSDKENGAQNEIEYYDMADFKMLIVGQSNFEDLIEQVGLPYENYAAPALSYGILVEYPAENQQIICVVLSYDGVILEIKQSSKGTGGKLF